MFWKGCYPDMNLFLAFNWSELSKGDLSVLTTLAGLIIVFAVLILLTLVISLLNKMGAASKNKSDKHDIEPSVPVSTPQPSVQTAPPTGKFVAAEEDESLIAVIAAAVYAFGESIGQTLAIKSVQRVSSQKGRDRRSAWANAGVRENTRPF